MTATAQLDRTRDELAQHVQRRPGRKRKKPVSLPQYGVGDATPERLAAARRKGIRLVHEVAKTPEGHPTPDRRKRFIGLLENRTLEFEEKRAGELLQAYYVASYGGSPSQFKYEPKIPSGMRELGEQEMRAEAQRQIARVRARLPRWVLPIVAEIEADAYQEADFNALRDIYYPGLSEKRARDKLNVLLSITCKLLCDVFEIEHAWTDRTRRIAEEIMDMNGRGVW